MIPSNASFSINARAIVIGGGIIAGVLIVLALLVDTAVHRWDFRAEGPNAALDVIPAEPRLLSAPRTDRVAFDIEKKKLIDNYRWDGHSATAAIPIDVAIRLMVDSPRGEQ